METVRVRVSNLPGKRGTAFLIAPDDPYGSDYIEDDLFTHLPDDTVLDLTISDVGQLLHWKVVGKFYFNALEIKENIPNEEIDEIVYPPFGYLFD